MYMNGMLLMFYYFYLFLEERREGREKTGRGETEHSYIVNEAVLLHVRVMTCHSKNLGTCFCLFMSVFPPTLFMSFKKKPASKRARVSERSL